MTLHEHYDGLKRQMEDLGYGRPNLEDRLRAELLAGKDSFVISYREQEDTIALRCFFNISRDRQDWPYKLDNYDSVLMRGDQILGTRSFTNEVPKNEALE